MKKLKRKFMRASVEAYACSACPGTPDACAALCGSDVLAMQNGLQAQVEVRYTTVYYNG